MMERSDAELLEGLVQGDQDTLKEVLIAFERGDRGAYNLLVKMLKCSEPNVENALRDSFADGDGLVAELICQAYYPFVELLCGYKFKNKTAQEITELTNGILGDFVKGAPSLQSNVSMRNVLYQRVCARYKAYLNSESVNSFGHEVPERKADEPTNATIENVKAAVARSSEEVPVVAASAPTVPPVEQSSASSNLPMPRRHSSRSEETVKEAASNPQLAEMAAKVVAVAAANQAQTPTPVESVLPPQATKKQVPRLAGYPSESHEAKNNSPYSVKLVKAMARMAERDFDTYQTIVMHYFGRKGYQKLCQDLGNRPIAEVGKSLCRGLLELGKEIFGL